MKKRKKESIIKDIEKLKKLNVIDIKEEIENNLIFEIDKLKAEKITELKRLLNNPDFKKTDILSNIDSQDFFNDLFIDFYEKIRDFFETDK